jgi:hypothetical protein
MEVMALGWAGFVDFSLKQRSIEHPPLPHPLFQPLAEPRQKHIGIVELQLVHPSLKVFLNCNALGVGCTHEHFEAVFLELGELGVALAPALAEEVGSSSEEGFERVA